MNSEGYDGRYLCFSLGSEEYAIPLLEVREVIDVPQFINVPFTPDHFCGVTNIRGQIISVLDLRKKFKIPIKDNPEQSVVICECESLTVGVFVDSVNSVVTIAQEDLSPRPVVESRIDPTFISALYRKDDRVVLILDVIKALDVKDRQAIENAKHQNHGSAQSA